MYKFYLTIRYRVLSSNSIQNLHYQQRVPICELNLAITKKFFWPVLRTYFLQCMLPEWQKAASASLISKRDEIKLIDLLNLRVICVRLVNFIRLFLVEQIRKRRTCEMN